MDYEFHISHYSEIYKKYWKKLIILMAAAMLLTFCFVLFKPTVYVSTVSLLLADSGSSLNSSGPGLAAGRFFNLIEMGSSSRDTIAAVLVSKRMANDIKNKFQDEYKPIWWILDTNPTPYGLKIWVKGPSPDLTEKVGHFCIENLNKINQELEITPNPQMVKVLDPATHGAPERRNILQKVCISGIFVFLIYSIYLFFIDWFKRNKK